MKSCVEDNAEAARAKLEGDLRRVMELVRDHPPEDQILFQKLFRHALTLSDREEFDDTIKTMTEILSDSGKSGGHAVQEIQLPSLEQEHPPRNPRLSAWTNHVISQIKSLREAKGWTQDDLAAASGLTQSHVSRIENRYHSPSHKTLARIAKALGVSVGDLDPEF